VRDVDNGQGPAAVGHQTSWGHTGGSKHQRRSPRTWASVLGVATALTAVAVPGGPAWADEPITVPPVGLNSGVQQVDTDIDGGASMAVVSCPKATWCMAGAKGGTIVKYDAGKWYAASNVFTEAGDDVDGISCPTEKFCMAVSYDGGYSIYSGGHWSVPTNAGVPYMGSEGVSCPTTSDCLAEVGGGQVASWFKGTWSTVDTTTSLGQSTAPVSCMPGGPDFCMDVDNYDNDTHLTSGTWSTVETIPGSQKNQGAVSCWMAQPPPRHNLFSRGRPTCTVVDDGGYAFSWDGKDWAKYGNIDAAETDDDLAAVSCTFDFCATIDASDHILWGTGSTWTKAFAMHTGGNPTDISCASTTFCMVVTANDDAAIIDPEA